MTGLTILAVLLTAFVFGGMAFFAAVMTPLIFSRLAAEQAGAFIRQVFPVYYLVMAGASLLAALAALSGRLGLAVILVLIAGGFGYARFWMIPRLNRLRDAGLAGDVVAEARFKRLHRGSVLLNMVQLAAAGGVLIALVV